VLIWLKKYQGPSLGHAVENHSRKITTLDLCKQLYYACCYIFLITTFISHYPSPSPYTFLSGWNILKKDWRSQKTFIYIITFSFIFLSTFLVVKIRSRLKHAYMHAHFIEVNSIQFNFILPFLHAYIYKAHVMQARAESKNAKVIIYMCFFIVNWIENCTNFFRFTNFTLQTEKKYNI
jgi:hypothetical protein